MGREIKRVSIDFEWPLGMRWKGYMRPYRSQKCNVCDGTGLNPATKKIEDDWYDFSHTGARWCDQIEQEEVDALIEAGRLMDFTHRFVRGTGYVKIDPPPQVTATMVNEWNSHGLGHDAINRWICVETRAKKLGVYGKCPICNGDGEIWFNERIRSLSEKWYEEERYDPPSGNGWQVWETVSEGSPVTPVLPTSEALIDYLVEHGDWSDQRNNHGGWSKENAEYFVHQTWSPSMIIINDGANISIKTPRDGA